MYNRQSQQQYGHFSGETAYLCNQGCTSPAHTVQTGVPEAPESLGAKWRGFFEGYR